MTKKKEAGKIGWKMKETQKNRGTNKRRDRFPNASIGKETKERAGLAAGGEASDSRRNDSENKFSRRCFSLNVSFSCYPGSHRFHSYSRYICLFHCHNHNVYAGCPKKLALVALERYIDSKVSPTTTIVCDFLKRRCPVNTGRSGRSITPRAKRDSVPKSLEWLWRHFVHFGLARKSVYKT